MNVKPYDRISDLPPAVRELSDRLQRIWMAVFNSVWSDHPELDDADRESLAASSAWAAVDRRQDKGRPARIKAASRKAETAIKKALGNAEPKLRRMLSGLWDEMKASVKLSEIEAAIRAGQLELPQLADWRRMYGEFIRGEWADAVKKIAESGIESQREAIDETGVDEAAVAAAVSAWIGTRGSALADEVSEEQRKAVRAMMTQFMIDTPEDPARAAKFVRPAIGLNLRDAAFVGSSAAALLAGGAGVSAALKVAQASASIKQGARAALIARTEGAGAFNAGIVETISTALRTTDAALKPQPRKIWVTARDELVCDRCAPLDGMEIAFGDNFDDRAGGTTTQTPPLHPNCRCTIVIEL